MDERIICIRGNVRLVTEEGTKLLPINVALKFDLNAIAEEVYEAVKGRDEEHALTFYGKVHDGCLEEI